MQSLIAAVRSSGAVAGIAYEGDADRIGVIDENGKIVWGDELMVLFSRAILNQRPGLPSSAKSSAPSVCTTTSAGMAADYVEDRAFPDQEQAQRGECRACGRDSGHMFFADRYYGFDDAVYASFRLLEIIDRNAKGLGATSATCHLAVPLLRFVSIAPGCGQLPDYHSVGRLFPRTL